MALFDFVPSGAADFNNSAGKTAVHAAASVVCPSCKGSLSHFKSRRHGKMMMGCKKCNKCVSPADKVTAPKDFARPSWWPFKGMSRKTFAAIPHKTLAEHLGNKSSKSLGVNKSLHKGENGDVHVKLHNTHVVTAHPNGDYTMRTGGFHSKTTNRVISGITGLKTNMKGGLIRGETGKPIEDGDLASAHKTPPAPKTPQQMNPQHYGEEPTLFERGQSGRTYEITTSRWGKVAYTLAGLTDFQGAKRVMLDSKEHGKASMALDKFKELFADFADPSIAPPAPVVAPPATPKLLDKPFVKQPPETTKVLHSKVLSGMVGEAKPNIVRAPSTHQSRTGGATKNAQLAQENPDFDKHVSRLANHMASMYARAQDPTAAVELPAYHDSFEHVYRQPGMVTKAAFAKAFPHLVQGNEGYPADQVEAASRYQRAVGEHLYKRRGGPVKEGSNVDKQEKELSNEPDDLNLESNLDRIRGFEKLHKRPWIQSVLKNLENSHPDQVRGIDHPEGFTNYKERFEKLKNGEYNPRQLRKLLQKLHTPLGSVTLEQLYKHVLPNLGYQVPTSDSADNQKARMQGAITPSSREAMLASHASGLPQDPGDIGYTDDKTLSNREEKRGMPEAVRAEALRARNERLYREAKTGQQPAAAPISSPKKGKGGAVVGGQAPAQPAQSSLKPAPKLDPVDQRLTARYGPMLEPHNKFTVKGHTYRTMFGGKAVAVPGKGTEPHIIFQREGAIDPNNPAPSKFSIPYSMVAEFIKDHHAGVGAANFDDEDSGDDFPVSTPGSSFLGKIASAGKKFLDVSKSPIANAFTGAASSFKQGGGKNYGSLPYAKTEAPETAKKETADYHIQNAHKELEPLGISDMWKTNLHTSPILRNHALNNGVSFHNTITKAGDSLTQALRMANDEPTKTKVSTKVAELERLKGAVDAFHSRRNYGKKGAGQRNIQLALDHLSGGGDRHTAVAHVMQHAKVKKPTARRYVAQALEHVRDREKQEGQWVQNYIDKYMDLPVAKVIE